MEDKLCGTYGIEYTNKTAGSLTVSREGLMVVFRARCHAETEDVLRLYCEGAEQSVSIGVPIPEAGALILRRSFSQRSLEELGLRQIDRCFLAPCAGQAEPRPAAAAKTDAGREKPRENGWRPAADLAPLFRDPELKRACGNIRSGLLRTENGFLSAAIPIRPDQPFPLMPVFCFGRSEFLDGKEYLVFRTKDGELCADE